ncbi:MAG: guanylate kinase [Proteobacteria bacterium]|jgi:guanylate kinase|nr:guanylate kinase [Alphaproteobacteria bacterium]NCC03580.1 guanylate kinase [Pseudomonadota bacterium]
MAEQSLWGDIQRRGLMLVLSSPSGAGKTTISRRLLQEDDQIDLSISVTTRNPRLGEVEGKDYFFTDPVEFNLMVNRDQLLEHAKVFGHYYGTPRAAVEAALSNGHDVLFDIDWQGTQQLSEKARDDLVSVFILPPNWKELERRLFSRAQDTPAEINRRMAQATSEMSHWAEYDYVIVNRDLDMSIAAVRAILQSERLKRRRLVGLSDFVKGLQSGA